MWGDEELQHGLSRGHVDKSGTECPFRKEAGDGSRLGKCTDLLLGGSGACAAPSVHEYASAHAKTASTAAATTVPAMTTDDAKFCDAPDVVEAVGTPAALAIPGVDVGKSSAVVVRFAASVVVGIAVLVFSVEVVEVVMTGGVVSGVRSRGTVAVRLYARWSERSAWEFKF